jgi:hypothetical protein
MNGTHLTLGLVGLAALAGAGRRGSRAKRPAYGDVAREDDYGPPGSYFHQPTLYHVTRRSNLDGILRHGLVRGRACNYETPSTTDLCRGRVYFSFQPNRWFHDHPDPVLLGVPTNSVRCRYDGAEWLYDDMDESDMERYGRLVLEGRLSDCYATTDVPPSQISVLDWKRAFERHTPWDHRIKSSREP